jgi:ABC-type branched-subunit amino acid transport system substrate-binding protein
LNRQQFLTSLASAGVLAALAPGELLSRTSARARGLIIGHVAPGGAQLGEIGSAAARGAQLGAADLAPGGVRPGGEVRLLETTATGAAESLAAAARLVERGATVLLGGFEPDTVTTLSDLAADQGVLLLNVGHGSDELRQRCSATTFHVEPSHAMREDALGLWVDAGGDRDSGATVVSWSGRLTRHGARHLNQRYHERFNESMSPASWASWIAVHVAWVAYSRTEGGDAMAMAEFLAGAPTRFDGRKGASLSFRHWDHQLRQPLYIARRDQQGELVVVDEVPSLSGSTRGADAALLDALGGPPRPERCVVIGE